MDVKPHWKIQAVNTFNALLHNKKQLAKLAAVFVFLLLLFTFNWDWLRPSLVSYVSHQSNRDVKVGRFDIEFSGFLNPTFEFEDLTIANATWSNKRPLIQAKKMTFKLNAVQFFTQPDARIVDITMSDAEINMERLRDGLRNWRLLNPDYKGPGKYKLRNLTAQRSVINFKNDAFDLIFNATVTDNLKVIDSKHLELKHRDLKQTDLNHHDLKQGDKTLPNKIVLSGSYLKSPFSGVVFSPHSITLQQTKQLFDLNGFVQLAKNKMYINGKVGDVIKNPLIDANIQLSGDAFSIVNLLKSSVISGQAPLSLSTHLYKRENQYKLNQIVADLQGSDFTGKLSYLHDKDTPKLSGNISSESIDIKRLLAIFSRIGKVNPQLKNQPSTLNNVKQSQLDLNLTLKKVKNLSRVQLSALNVRMKGEAGKYNINVSNARLNGGQLAATATLDIAKKSPDPSEKDSKSATRLKAQISVNQLQIATLLDSTKLDDKLNAPVNVKANINAVGDTYDGIIKSLAGKLDVAIGKGIISNKLDAKLGLDLGKLAWLSLRGDKNIALNCGKLAMDIKQGVATSNVLWVNTEQTIVNGKANVNLVNQRVNLMLDPQPKDPGLFAINQSIQISGQLATNGLSVKITDSPIKQSAQNASNYACNSL